MEATLTDEEFVELAGDVPPNLYLKLGVKLGLKVAQLEQILQSKQNDFYRSFVEILMIWNQRKAPTDEQRTKRTKLAEIFTSVGLQTLSNQILAGSSSSQSIFSMENTREIIPQPPAGLTDNVLTEIADSLETDAQLTSLALALGQTFPQINKCLETNRLSGSVTTKGTINLLISWKATVQPESQMSVMYNAMTKAKVIYIRDTVLAKARKIQEREKQEYERRVQQQQQRQLEDDASLSPSFEASQGNDAPSSLHSTETRGISSPQSASDTRRADSLRQRQPTFYDIYLVYSKETEHVRRVKDIICKNGWTMLTPSSSKLGVPKLSSVQDALQTCSHVVLIITADDCRMNDSHRIMTIEMAFESSVGGIVDGRVISVRCCEEACLPLKLRCLTNVSVLDECLEERLKESIDTSIRIQREGSPLQGQCPMPPKDDAIESEGTVGAPSSLNSSQLSSQMQPFLQHLEQATAGGGPSLNSGPGPAYSLNIQGNVYNIGSLNITPRPDDEVTSRPIVIPSQVRIELSKLLNEHRFTHDDWTGLADILGLDDCIESLKRKSDPTADLIDLAVSEEKVRNLEDMKDALVRMKRDDCIEVINHFQGQGTLTIKDADEESWSDEF